MGPKLFECLAEDTLAAIMTDDRRIGRHSVQSSETTCANPVTSGLLFHSLQPSAVIAAASGRKPSHWREGYCERQAAGE